MDLNLLAKTIKESLIENQKAEVPSLGTFLFRISAARVSEDEKTILPPSGSISFKSDTKVTGESFIRYCSSRTGISVKSTTYEMHNCIENLKRELSKEKRVHLPELGLLTPDNAGVIIFTPEDEDSICRDIFGFTAVPVKPIKENKQVQQESHTDNTLEIAEKKATQEKDKETPKEKKNKEKKKKGLSKAMMAAIISIAAIIIVLVAIYLLGRFGLLDSIIYTEEELELIKSSVIR